MAEPVIAGRYEVVALLGRGGMGAVYEARHIGTGRRVAVKVISPDLAQNRRLLGRFEVEARAAGALESDHIAQVFDVGFDDGRGSPFLVMEYLEGEDLSELLLRVGALEPEPALALFAQACKGLEKAHKKGIIHRDIKPANLFLTEVDDDLRRLKILDFGIAKMKRDDDASGEPSTTKSGGFVGSPLYMSPEQARARGGVDHRSDLWSVGVVLYEMLTGRAPFAHIEAVGDLIIAICSEPAPPLRLLSPWVSPEIEEIVMKALSINPSARYQQASEMVAAARALLPAGLDVTASALSTPSYRRLTGETALSVPFALAKPASKSPVSARQEGGHASMGASPPPSEGPTLPRFVPPPATTRTTSAAVSDTTASVAEPTSQRVAVMGAIGVLIGASITLAIGLALVGSPAGADAVAQASSSMPSATVTAQAVSAAPTIEVTPASAEVSSTSAPASSAPAASASSPPASAAPSASSAPAPKLTGRLPVAPPPKPTGPVELYDL